MTKRARLPLPTHPAGGFDAFVDEGLHDVVQNLPGSGVASLGLAILDEDDPAFVQVKRA